MQSQLQRVQHASTFTNQWHRAFSASGRYTQSLEQNDPMDYYTPVESHVTSQEEARFADPLCLQRARYDVEYDSETGTDSMDTLIAEQAELLRAHLAEPETQLNQAERMQVGDSHIRIVNKVCTVYARPLEPGERSLEVDEESEYAATKQSVQDARRVAKGGGIRSVMAQLDQEWEDAPLALTDADGGNKKSRRPKKKGMFKKPQPPSVVSLRSLQRRWLRMGYNKNSVGTALRLRYTQPLTSTHIFFCNGRIFSSGSNNRRNDRAGIKYATVPYMHRPLKGRVGKSRRLPKGRPFGAVKRISQNIVASQRLPPGREICLGLLCKQFEDTVRLPLKFKSIVLNDIPNRATLLVYRRNIICVGTSSWPALAATYAKFAPTFLRCQNTPENLAAERAWVKSGIIDAKVAQNVLNYQILEDGHIVRMEDDDEPEEEEEEEEEEEIEEYEGSQMDGGDGGRGRREESVAA